VRQKKRCLKVLVTEPCVTIAIGHIRNACYLGRHASVIVGQMRGQDQDLIAQLAPYAAVSAPKSSRLWQPLKYTGRQALTVVAHAELSLNFRIGVDNSYTTNAIGRH
jgi:hypothetical protein